MVDEDSGSKNLLVVQGVLQCTLVELGLAQGDDVLLVVEDGADEQAVDVVGCDAQRGARRAPLGGATSFYMYCLAE